jgi:hypothetical protein
MRAALYFMLLPLHDMLKRTRGYLLLVMLVLTGLAGRLHWDILSGKERSLLVDSLKITKALFLQSTDKLSTHQLNYKSSREDLSIKDYSFLIAETEKRFQQLMIQINSLRSPSSTDKRVVLNYHPLCFLIKNFPDLKSATEQMLFNKHSKEKDLENLFKQYRANELRYARTTTENLHHYIIKADQDSIDLYQLSIHLTEFDRQCIEQIGHIKQSAGFPLK